jgi:hypothetical protein
MSGLIGGALSVVSSYKIPSLMLEILVHTGYHYHLGWTYYRRIDNIRGEQLPHATNRWGDSRLWLRGHINKSGWWFEDFL